MSIDDEFETPPQLFKDLCYKYRVFPKLDVCCSKENTLCEYYYTKEMNGLEQQWLAFTDWNNKHDEGTAVDVWCNPPHSITGKFVEKAYNEWRQNNINVLMIIPANTVSSKFWHKYIEGHAEYHAQPQGRIKFNKQKQPTKYQARNAYMVVIWRVR